MQLNAYLNFYGHCEEALEFYKPILNGTYELTRMGDASSEGYAPPPEHKDKVMHATFRFDGGEFMASDGRPGTQRPPDSNVSLSIATKDVEEAKRIYDALSVGGEIDMPMQQTFWSPAFGMFTDKFGIFWMISALA